MYVLHKKNQILKLPCLDREKVNEVTEVALLVVG